MYKNLTQEELKKIITYDPITGIFRRIKGYGFRIPAGSIVGAISSHGYLRIGLKGKIYYAHQLAFLYMLGHFPVNQVDHKNRQKLNNSWDNLVEATASENIINAKEIWSHNTSGVRGVSWDSWYGKWEAIIEFRRKRIRLGRFNKIEDAISARKAGEGLYFGN